jgi:RsiW-degrading membrane proteinase PrsW (M82 family)
MAVETYCPHCGSVVAPETTRCPTCGATLRAPAALVLPADDAAPPVMVRSAGPTPPEPAMPPFVVAGSPPQMPLSPARTVPAAPAVHYAPYPAPGYPAYPQGAPPPSAPYPYAAPPYPYPYTYYPSPFVKPRRAPGETYPLVVAWIVTVLGGISILVGLFAGLIAALLSVAGFFSSLLFLNLVLAPAVTGVFGGVYAMVAGISRIRNVQSKRFSMPNPWLFVALTAVVMAVGVVLWNVQVDEGPGAALAVWPLNVLSAAIPAFGMLAFVAWRLRFPASRRHVWLSVIYGLTLGPLIAIILEIVVSIVIDSSVLSNPNALNPNDPTRVIQLLIEISVAAPLVEEMVKPLGAVLIMPRLKTASAAFLVGVAGGVGFAMFESVFTYIGTGEADWVDVALQRAGSSILHGLGAGMVALAWFYLFHGRGVANRWWKVAGCVVYAVFQHGLNNAVAVLISFVPGPVGTWFNAPFYLGSLPMQYGILPFYGLDVAMFVVLIIVTGRLARGDQQGDEKSLRGAPAAYAAPMPAVTGGAAR